MLHPFSREAKVILSQVRFYAASVSPPRVYPGKKTPRNYSVRKVYLYNQYTKLLTRGDPLLFLNHKNFSAQQLIKLRRDIATVKSPIPPSLALSPAPILPGNPELLLIRTGILGVVLRQEIALLHTQKLALVKLITDGAVAALTLPTFDPPQLAALIRVLERAVPSQKISPTSGQAARDATTADNPTPGRRQKRVRPDHPPELELKGALIEGRLFVREQLKEVSTLPTLESLRAQILGLISAPAMQLTTILGDAGGGQLLRTLEGFRKGLEAVSDADASEQQ